MKVKILRRHPITGDAHRDEIEEVEKLLAASDVFPYWTFWYPEDKEGTVRVRFFAMDEVKEVDMVGEKEERHLATVTDLKGAAPGIEYGDL